MGSKREKWHPQKMRRIALVICEGETEASYINMLKKWYKSPIRVISHIEGTRVSQSLIDNRTRELKISRMDKVSTFLMYDMDVPTINEKLFLLNAEKLLSNPCFELWLLLHSKEQKSVISTDATLRELKSTAPVWKNYSKAEFSVSQQTYLKENLLAAVARAKTLKEFQNPSSGIYRLIDLLTEK